MRTKNEQRRAYREYVREGKAAFDAYCAAADLPPVERKQDYTVSDAIDALLYFAQRRGQNPLAILERAESRFRAEQVVVESCAKCGAGISQTDLEEGPAVTDEGSGPEAGNTFTYCSQGCLEAH